MADQDITGDGIDFFDFVYAVWRSKWIFLLTVVGVAALTVLAYSARAIVSGAGGAAVVSGDGAPNATERFVAKFGVSIDAALAPYRRDAGELLADFDRTLEKTDSLGLVNNDRLLDGDPKPDRLYSTKLGEQGRGWVLADIKGGSPELAEKIRAEFETAAKTQFETIRDQAQRDVVTIKDITANYNAENSDTLAKELYYKLRFLSRPDVKDETYRFVRFGPIRSPSVSDGDAGDGRSASIGPSSRSLAKISVIGVILGFILACILVVFRIAIERKRADGSTA